LSELKCSRKRLLPKLALATFNRNLKKITRLARWTYTILKSRKQRGISKNIHAYQNTSNELRFCDLVSSHIMRRTAITNLLMLGVPELVVKKIFRSLTSTANHLEDM